MNLDAARQVADAVLYEGYLLYPYRASAQKNRSRWQFGVVMPAAYVATDPSERSVTQTECVLEYTDTVALEIVVRFLQVQRRAVQRWSPATDTYQAVETLEVDGTPVSTWDEAVEREVTIRVPTSEVLGAGRRHAFSVQGGQETEPVSDRGGRVLGRLVRTRRPLSGLVTVSADALPGPWRALRLRVHLDNSTPLDSVAGRESALPTAMVAVHTVMGVSGGTFLSMVDPQEWAREAVEECENIGAWPVLAGPPRRRDLMLSAPIILYDHVELAPESPGDLFDATEIDEILTLRTLALSDSEKREARATDPRAATVIDRTEALDGTQLERLHGAIRSLRTIPPVEHPDGGSREGASPDGGSPDGREPAATATPWWDPGADAGVSPTTDTVLVAGHRVGRGTRVRLLPGARRADAQDMFLTGREAIVEAVLLDVDDNPYLAVTLAEDPAADLQRSHGRYLYFTPDEVEPCEVPA